MARTAELRAGECGHLGLEGGWKEIWAKGEKERWEARLGDVEDTETV